VILFVPPVVAGAREVAASIRRAVDDVGRVKPVVAVVVSAEGVPEPLRGPGSPVVALPYPESAARALALAAKRADWLRAPEGELPPVEGVDANAARDVVEAALAGASDRWLDPASTQALLEAYGISTVGERVAASVEDAVTAADELGYPVVVKTAAPGVHKTDVGGVALDLRTEGQVRAAAERIGAPLLVQPFLGGRIELLAGVVQDPVFGPLVAFGPGGALAELIGDASFRLAPLTDRDADELVQEGKAGRLVAGFRGSEPANAPALVDLVVRLGRLAEDLPQVAELDLNPILAGPTGCVAVDARVRVRAQQPERRIKGW
jgi:acyl-CoA synthetase (NDP forming)